MRFSSTLRKFSCVRRFLMKSTPNFLSSFSPPRSSAEMTVICSGSMAICRKISGSTPWPIEPKPIMTMRPGKEMSFFETFLETFLDLRPTFFAICIPAFSRMWSINSNGASSGPV